MELSVGQKVSYPNQGICLIEQIEKKKIGSNSMRFYALRVLSDNSTIFVPLDNAENVGLRPILEDKDCKRLLNHLAKDFDKVSSDWKVRSREFNEKLQTGDLFEVAEVLKMLTFLSHEKKLSFREQSYLDKSKFLLVSEIANSGYSNGEDIESKIEKQVEKACQKHILKQPTVAKPKGH